MWVYRYGDVPTGGSDPGPGPTPTPPPTGGRNGGSSSGNTRTCGAGSCGALGVEALLLVGFLAFLRRR